MVDFTILVLPGAYASSVAVTVDILRAAAVLAPRSRLAPPTWRVLSTNAARVPLSNGLSVDASVLSSRRGRDSSIWIVPGLGLTDGVAIASRLASADAQHAVRALATHASRGGEVAASCSAVFLLQAAGLLSGRRVTTTWWLAAELRRIEPNCTVDADRMVCADGPVATAGAAFAQTDLMLHLLRVRFGVALAETVAKMLLIDARQAQADFVDPTMLAGGNRLIAELVERIEAALPSAPNVEKLARAFAMSPRTLSRRVQEATGRSTMALVQSVRLGRARMLLESSRMSIDSVAEQVGYADATALRRLMRKMSGSNPGRYRRSGPGA